MKYKWKTEKKENYYYMSSKRIYLMIQDERNTYGIIFNHLLGKIDTGKFHFLPRLPMHLNWIHISDSFITCKQNELIKELRSFQDINNTQESLTIEKNTMIISSKRNKKLYDSPGIAIHNPLNLQYTLNIPITTFLKGITSIKEREWQKSCISFVKVDDKHVGMSVICSKHSFGIITEILK